MKKLLAVAALAAVLFAGCWSAEETKNANENTEPTAGRTNENDQPRPEAGDESAETKTEAPKGPLSPTETLLEFDRAVYARDAERLKKVISKSTYEYFESEAKKQGMTFKQLVERPSEMPTVETPATRNEKISGNTATVEAQNRVTGSYDTYPLVREDGVWKVEYEKYLKQKLEELNKVTKPVPEGK
jgi:hypothetical protein